MHFFSVSTPIRFLSSPRALRFNKNGLIFCCLLRLCGDILPNPGPFQKRFPCTVCYKSVTSRQRGIECSRCENWTRTSCAGVSTDEYNHLSIDPSVVWYCPNCTTAVYELPFADCSLSNSVNSDHSISSSVDILEPPSRSLSCICLNAHSIVNKQLDLLAMISRDYPDIVVITETFLDASILNS